MRSLVLVAAVLAAAGCQGLTPNSPTPGSGTTPGTAAPVPGNVTQRPADAEGPWPVTAVVDGDTVKVRRDGAVVTVRVIGIDTPETKDPRKPVQCYGREASARAHELLDGNAVWLEQDPTQDTVDRYGRRLAYVWLPDGSLFELQMLAGGFAHEYRYDRDYQRRPAFRAAEAEARAAGRGLWSPSTCAGDTKRPA